MTKHQRGFLIWICSIMSLNKNLTPKTVYRIDGIEIDFFDKNVELTAGLEPATSFLPRTCSAN
jgi:hypothetical protein